MSICGVVTSSGAPPIESGELQAMISALTLQGEDTSVSANLAQAALGGTSAHGAVSLCASDGLLVVCDGELYNLDELREMISRPALQDDAAGLIAARYRQHGESFIQLLRGVFALAIWDEKDRSLLLARDRFGVKPLCYAATRDYLAFAGYPRGIFAGGRAQKRADSEAIVEYLNYGSVPAPQTAFAGVKKINPGEYLLWRAGHTRCVRYWDLRYPEDAQGPEQELAHELLARMEEAVRVTSTGLDPDASGCFLSGGTDSSSIVGLLTRIYGRPVNTFSMGFPEDSFNELHYAHVAVQRYNSRHHEAIIGPAEAYDVINQVAEGYDEPFANSSAIPAYCCARLAREAGIKTLMAGDGGDELFGGNERYRVHQVYARYLGIPRIVRRTFEPLLFALPKISPAVARLQRQIERCNVPNPERYSQRRLVLEFPLESILDVQLPRPQDRLAVVRRYYQGVEAKTELNRLLYIDIKMTLGDDDLPKVVRTTELAGINVRFPYLDYRLADFSGRLPARLKVHGLEKRYLFKKATQTLLPEEILRKKKHGFGLPIGIWLNSDPRLREFSRDILLDPKAYQRGYFKRQFVEQVIARIDEDNARYARYFGELLFLFLMLELWHRKQLEGIQATTVA